VLFSNQILNKKNIRIASIGLLILLVLLGVSKACFFSNGRSLKDRYHLIARNINWNDFQFTGKEPNVQAFAEELVLAAAKEANLRIQFVSANPNTLLEDLRAGGYDAVFTFMVPNSINESHYFFSDPLYMLGMVLVVRENSDVRYLEQMENRLVGMSAGSPSIYEVNRQFSMILLTYDNINSALEDLNRNKIDGVIMDMWHAHVMTKSFYAGRLKIATRPFTRQGLRLVTLANTDLENFMKSLNDGLERVKASGLYHQLVQKWDLYELER